MKAAYFWCYVGILVVATLFNYWLVSDNKGWNSGRSSSHYSSTGSWHK